MSVETNLRYYAHLYFTEKAEKATDRSDIELLITGSNACNLDLEDELNDIWKDNCEKFIAIEQEKQSYKWYDFFSKTFLGK